MLDAATPYEVWLEYESRKRGVRGRWLDPSAYEQEIARIAHALGVGVPSDMLTPEQREEQQRAFARWKGGRCAS